MYVSVPFLFLSFPLALSPLLWPSAEGSLPYACGLAQVFFVLKGVFFFVTVACLRGQALVFCKVPRKNLDCNGCSIRAELN